MHLKIFVSIENIILKLYIAKKTKNRYIKILPEIISKMWIMGNFFVHFFLYLPKFHWIYIKSIDYFHKDFFKTIIVAFSQYYVCFNIQMNIHPGLT